MLCGRCCSGTEGGPQTGTRRASSCGGSKQTPSRKEWVEELVRSDVLMFVGHNGGERFVHPEELGGIYSFATVMLMGCKSGAPGEPAGVIVANQWVRGCFPPNTWASIFDPEFGYMNLVNHAPQDLSFVKSSCDQDAVPCQPALIYLHDARVTNWTTSTTSTSSYVQFKSDGFSCFMSDWDSSKNQTSFSMLVGLEMMEDSAASSLMIARSLLICFYLLFLALQ